MQEIVFNTYQYQGMRANIIQGYIYAPNNTQAEMIIGVIVGSQIEEVSVVNFY